MAEPENKRPVHQLVNHLSRGDAIGHDVLTIQDRLRAEGRSSEIFCLHHGPGLSGRHRPVSSFLDSCALDDIVLWHFSIGTSLFDLAAEFPGKVVMRYHNITPHQYFMGINPQLELDCRVGRIQLARAARFVDLAIGDSAYNQGELDALGYVNTGNCPINLDLAKYAPVQPPARMAHLAKGGPNILHVGRFMPQKRYEDLLRTFHFLHKIKPEARLILVGGWDGLEKYRAFLGELVERLKVNNVIFTGRISDADLRAIFGLCQVYLCLSEHEGFCVPLVEAMKMDLPVVAKRSTAVGETLGPAGVLLNDYRPSHAAEVIAALVDDRDRRREVRWSQQRRLEDLAPDKVWNRFRELLQQVDST